MKKIKTVHNWLDVVLILEKCYVQKLQKNEENNSNSDND